LAVLDTAFEALGYALVLGGAAFIVPPIPDHPIHRAMLKPIELVGHVPPLIGELPESVGNQPIMRLIGHVVALICFRRHFLS
jgi:hypothetical protein